MRNNTYDEKEEAVVEEAYSQLVDQYIEARRKARRKLPEFAERQLRLIRQQYSHELDHPEYWNKMGEVLSWEGADVGSLLLATATYLKRVSARDDAPNLQRRTDL